MDASADPAADPEAQARKARAAARAEKRLVMLDEMADIAMDVVRELRGEILAAGAIRPEEGAPGQPTPARRRNIADLVLAFHRASRALRLTLALQEQLEAAARPADAADADGPEPRALKVLFIDSFDGIQSDAYKKAEHRAAFEAVEARRLQIGRTVRSLAEAGAGLGGQSPQELADFVERACREAGERLETEAEFADLTARPLSEIIDSICRDLGLSPDWPRLAEEPWARFERAAGPVGAPLAAVRRGKNPPLGEAPPNRPSEARPGPTPPSPSPQPQYGAPAAWRPPPRPEEPEPTWLPGEGPPPRRPRGGGHWP